jgi:circadian clock protein KaiB
MIESKAISPCLAISRQPTKVWTLHLYVTGRTSKSLAAYANLKTICESRMKGCYRITVIDVAERPHLAKEDQIFATPIVVCRHPRPIRRVIGNLSDPVRILGGLNMT